jgi:SAM-dependent methyltransferase|tara:strand:- start:236 stop:1084 length:849 start_codon:yes stop_codon:yes gene_type:complete
LKKNQKNLKITTKDFLVTGESFDLLLDSKRDLLITSPQPKAEDLAKYYKSDAYISHTDSKETFVASLYQNVKKYSLALKLRLILTLNGSPGSLLDIGAGTGDFLKLAKDNGWDVKGVEPNDGASNLARKKNLEIYENIDMLSGKTFDVVTLWHVLEHLPDLEIITQKIEDLIKPGGTLIVAVPNFKSYDAKHYKNYWAAYDTPRHLWHFSKTAMSTIFSSSITLVKSKPMIFDSFYVSLLSEKYKTGKSFSIKALLIGLWSNISALNSKEYSSHIYCYKKTF